MIETFERCDKCNMLIAELKQPRDCYERPAYLECVSQIDYCMVNKNESFALNEDTYHLTLCEHCSSDFAKMMDTFMGDKEHGKK